MQVMAHPPSEMRWQKRLVEESDSRPGGNSEVELREEHLAVEQTHLWRLHHSPYPQTAATNKPAALDTANHHGNVLFLTILVHPPLPAAAPCHIPDTNAALTPRPRCRTPTVAARPCTAKLRSEEQTFVKLDTLIQNYLILT